jgi:Domain of unknown function (DUF4390)
LWFDAGVFSKTIKQRVKYNALKQQHRVSEINGLFLMLPSIKVTTHEPTMVRWMSAIKGQPLIPFHLLQPGGEYDVKAMADLKAAQSPFALGHMAFLAGLWETGSPWTASSPFTITPPAQH